MMEVMSPVLSRLRLDLDFSPSPSRDHPGLLIRDPLQYSETALVIPPPLVECLQLFDGESTELDLRERLARVTGSIQVEEIAGHLRSSLRDAGFLEDEVYRRLRDDKHRTFAEASVREATHAGSGYPEDPESIRSVLEGYLSASPSPVTSPLEGLLGIAAPHVSPNGGWRAYSAAYRALVPEHKERIFIILGTSHYGAPNHFGLTRKNFVTPLGEARTETALVDRLAGAGAVEMEDYCHLSEHSIEFQVIFLQHLFGGGVRILPILCGSYARSIYEGGRPEDDEGVRRFIGELGAIGASGGDRFFWVLGVDMAHMGRRYGDSFPAVANEGVMKEVAGRDRARIEKICERNPDGFWSLIQENKDDLKWCGSSVFYTFLRAVPKARGRLLGYEQWNIDEQSVVTFGALGFTDATNESASPKSGEEKPRLT